MRCSSLIALLSLLSPAALADEPDDGWAAVDADLLGLSWQRAEAAPVAPLSLTASDGSGLALVSLQAQAVVRGPLAYTELRLSFHNPEARQREGRFQITLPSGAAISRFAMRQGDAWQEGEVVEKQLAHRIYEDFLHQRQDPALLENEAGNQFRARVFPIAAGGDKDLIISWSQELAEADAAYTLPLAGLPALDRLDVDVQITRVGQAPQHLEMHRQGSAPEGDLSVALAGRRQEALRSGHLAVARVAPRFAVSAAPVSGLTLLFDTSASRALGWETQVQALGDLVAELRRSQADFPLRVVAFDQDAEIVFEGRSSGFSSTVLAGLRHRGALGASNLGAALRTVGPHERVVIVTDGVATAGETDNAALSEAVAHLASRGVRRLDAVVTGGLRDDDVLGGLVTALSRDGVVVDASDGVVEAARRLTQATASGLTVTVPGASWVWPTTLDGVQPGDEVLVYADLPADQALSVRLDGEDVGALPALDVAGPLLEREWVQARMSRLASLRDAADLGDVDLRAAMEAQIAQLSVTHRVLTDSTALLVLESEADYQRYGLLRRGLSDVLVVDDGVLRAVQRTGSGLPPMTVNRMAVEERVAWDGPATDGPDAITGVRADDDTSDEWASAAMPVMEDQEVDAMGSRAPVAAPQGGLGRSMRGRRGAIDRDEVALEEGLTPNALTPAPDVAGPTSAPASRAPATRLQAVLNQIASDHAADALALARAWHDASPGDVLGLVALGEAMEAMDDVQGAARAYGSIIDLFPGRADLRRMAGERLERLGDPARELAIDTYRKARDARPDHPSGHRQLAWALVKAGQPEEAFDVMEAAVKMTYPGGRFAGVNQVMREDLGLIGAAWTASDPAASAQVARRLRDAGGVAENRASTRFVLTWETDANDVDLHVFDGKNNHAWYSDKHMLSGGDLYADVTTGYGPECFTVNGSTHGPYRLQAHYYSQGPMGYGMGTVQVIAHDGAGHFTFDEHPFVIQDDDAWVEVGTWDDRDTRTAGLR